MSSETDTKVPQRRRLTVKPTLLGDRIFFGITTGTAYFSIVLVALVLVFLLIRAWPAFQHEGFNFIVGSKWDDSVQPMVMQIFPMLYGSILLAILGVLLAVPMAIALAYLIEFLAPKPIARVATLLVDLLAALPSVVIGLWGLFVFSPVAEGWSKLLNQYLGWLPFFANSSGNFSRSPFIAGWIVAVMIVPIITSVTREIFSQMDRDLINAAKALGGGMSSTFTKVILPTASSGIVGGTLLGLGRALGETVAIFFVLNLSFDTNWFQLVEARGGSIASMILGKLGNASDYERSGLMAAGVVLFVTTLVINFIAGYIVNRAQPWRK